MGYATCNPSRQGLSGQGRSALFGMVREKKILHA